jgi:hypothetical protein
MTVLETAQSSLDPFHFGNSSSRPSQPPEGSKIVSDPGKWTRRCEEVHIPLNFVIGFISGRMQEWLQATLRYVILKICHMRNLSSYYGAMGQHLIEWPAF